ncbi:hypothetical protein VD0002_g2909 [Verticillium dahliae]|uniref:Cell wall protein PhiA n=2 Tax=Verticillium dahliae TaxID=27337 RepID=G2WXK1_VERDV|nr:cell wall protein PhiA [Verticillium dahliae VdLs.17]KAF3351426.1 Tyrosinase [Verticillium dahliae VDG2]KAH6707458.1 cell wall protein PhiA [Verticillium dahliae]EGY21456.1 cell wall protein PhiA [Verticillium dahliae VdLs.17]PNH26420.1 hypothetical protein BJF96_g10281 [Verticillium dahliae]PNH39770.1 hypothetical protein VD0004_g7137 [Verticillium dahliae]
MHFQILGAASFAAAASAAALPASSGPLPAGAKFNLLALRSASPVHFADVSAAQGSLFLNLPSQNATCDGSCGNSSGSATFYLNDDGGLYLYSTSATPQQLYADRSGMGQGNLGYTTGAQPPPRNGERTGWVLDEVGDLTLNGAGFIACPNSIDGAWSLWVSAGVNQPGGNEGCLSISARATEVKNPDSCVYTS